MDTSLRWTLSAGPKGVRLRESHQETYLVCCFCGHFGDQEMLLAMNLSGRSILQGTLKQFGLEVFKIMIKNRGQRFVSVSHFVNEFASVAGYVFMSFSWGFYQKNLAFFPEIDL